MRLKGGEMVLGRKGLGATLAVLAALFAFALFTDPAWAQVTSIDKTGPDEVLAGQDFSYTIAVRTGADADSDVVVEDVLPTGVDLNGPLPANCTSTEATNVVTVTCDLDEVAANTTETITLNVEAPDTPGTITNTATSERETDTVTTDVRPAADLVITKTANPEPVDVGDNLAYTLRVTNEGPQAATAVELVDDLPGNVILISVDEGDNECTIEPGQIVECDLGNLAPDDSTTVRIFVEPEEAGTVTNTARVRSTTADPNPDNNEDSVTTTVQDGPGPNPNPGDVIVDERNQENTCNQVVNIVNEVVQNNYVDNSQDDEAAAEDQQAGDPANPVDGLLVDEVTDEQIVDIAQALNVSPVIVQQCIQQNAGRDANINSNNAEENIDEEIIDEEVVIDEEFDDDEAVVLDDRRGEVLAGSFPNKLLPNTGGISPFAILVALGFTFLLAGLPAGYAVARRRS